MVNISVGFQHLETIGLDPPTGGAIDVWKLVKRNHPQGPIALPSSSSLLAATQTSLPKRWFPHRAQSSINNRPNGEEAHQPGSAAEKSAAEDAGLGYSFIPVAGPHITEADVRAFQEAVAAAPGPVFAHCRSGTRSSTLYAIGEVLDGRSRSPRLPLASSRARGPPALATHAAFFSGCNTRRIVMRQCDRDGQIFALS